MRKSFKFYPKKVEIEAERIRKDCKALTEKDVQDSIDKIFGKKKKGK